MKHAVISSCLFTCNIWTICGIF